MSKAIGSSLLFILIGVFSARAVIAQAPIVQPGAPGQDSKNLSAEQAIEIAATAYSPADVLFMQDMIPHHHQAIEMAALVGDRTNRQELVDIAGRIDASQADEISFMQDWLAGRNEVVPDPTAHDAMHTSHTMAGMASPEQMAQLAASQGIDFDRLFLQLMIRHHDGAVDMVKELLEQPGAAYDPVLYEFTSDITNDQVAEIERMNALLISLSDDPRAGLAPGYSDAGEAISNMKLIASLTRPAGFFDPENPIEAPILSADDEESEDEKSEPEEVLTTGGEVDENEVEPIEGIREGASARSPMLSFSNTDMAFRDDILFAGNYHGFNIYRLGNEGAPSLISSVVCPGGQGDVSVVGDLLFMSAQETRGRLDCGLQGVLEDVSEERFRGLRIFDISDLEQPKQVGAVQTCRGSHTHSVVSGPDANGNIIVYNSGTSSIREEEEMPGCFDDTPGDQRTALFRIDVIEVPVSDPGQARIIDSPAVFADAETGVMAGLWRGGDHGDDTQETSQTDECHDITVFPERHLAAGACSGNGVIFDISDPSAPTRIDVVADTGFAYWHSATFNNDGTKVLFTDEWGGGSRPRCRTHDPLTWGANAFYDIVDGKLEFRSYFKMPAPQTDTENCVAHNGSIVPVPGRDIFVQAWYQGGISVIDFTDSSNPVEIAFFDRGPIDAENLTSGGFWSTYWYQGRIYGTEIYRGLDVLELIPSEHLSLNELAAAQLADQGNTFNPQQQLQVSWPSEPVVALAYIDQLVRSGAMSSEHVTAMSLLLETVSERLDRGVGGKRLAKRLQKQAHAVAAQTGSPSDTARFKLLSGVLMDLSGRLR